MAAGNTQREETTSFSYLGYSNGLSQKCYTQLFPLWHFNRQGFSCVSTEAAAPNSRALPLRVVGKIDLDQSENRTIRMSAELLLIPHYENKVVGQDR